LREQGQPAIVVDAGTAVNVDLIDAQGGFCGGTIFPGVRMMARALAHDTDLLPEIRFEGSQELPALVGTATVPAIRSGLFYGTVGAIGEIVRRYRAQLDREAAVYLTGGDAGWLTKHLPSDHTVVADLGLQGIAAVAMEVESGKWKVEGEE
jgi:type III pantothenate kinase